MTNKSGAFPLTTAEGTRRAALRPGQREPMGQRVARSASPEIGPEGVYRDAPDSLMDCSS